MADTESKTFSSMTNEEQLAEVNDAIHAVLRGAQSYKIGSRSVVRADLSLLRAMREELQAEIAAEGESSLLDNTYVAVFEPR
jgi:hypothetical protein